MSVFNMKKSSAFVFKTIYVRHEIKYLNVHNTKLIIHHAYTGTYGDILLTGNGMPQNDSN